MVIYHFLVLISLEVGNAFEIFCLALRASIEAFYNRLRSQLTLTVR